jgi:thioredoxin 1
LRQRRGTHGNVRKVGDGAATLIHPWFSTESLNPSFEEIMSENIKHITDASFEIDVLKSDKPVLVDFWAEWCGPCKSIAPILEEIAKEYDGKLLIAKMDVDSNQAVPAKFGIRGIPTLILFKNGVPAAQKVGAMAKGQLTSFIDSNI